MNLAEDKSHSPRGRRVFLSAAACSAVAALLCLVVAAVMANDYLRLAAFDPINSPQLNAMKDRLAADEDNAALRDEIRRLDQDLRQEYSLRRWRIDSGRHILLAGVVAMLLSASVASMFYRGWALQKLPASPRGAGGSAPTAAFRRELLGMTIALVGLGGVAGLLAAMSPAQPVWRAKASSTVGGAASPKSVDSAAARELARSSWPRFRGPDGTGVVRSDQVGSLPISFDAASGKGVLWKVQLPDYGGEVLSGKSSPIVWGKRVFLTGATQKGNRLEVFCFDADSGKLLWRQPVTPGAGIKRPDTFVEPASDTGYAAPTPATDGEMVYAMFATGDIAAFTLEGKARWARNFGWPQNPYGHASSLLTFDAFPGAQLSERGGVLLVQYDQGEASDGKSALIAIKGQTSQEAWHKARDVRASWSTPIVIRAGGKDQLVTFASPWTIAYELPGGAELWRVNVLGEAGGDIAPSPAFVAGMVIVAQQYARMAAIRPLPSGADAPNRIVWTAKDGLPQISSPLAFSGQVDGQQRERLLLVDDNLITLYDAQAGKRLWEQAVDSAFGASAILAGDRIYLFGREGLCYVIDAGPGARAYKELGRSSLGEPVSASPAVSRGRMYVRTEKHLFCIGDGGRR